MDHQNLVGVRWVCGPVISRMGSACRLLGKSTNTLLSPRTPAILKIVPRRERGPSARPASRATSVSCRYSPPDNVNSMRTRATRAGPLAGLATDGPSARQWTMLPNGVCVRFADLFYARRDVNGVLHKKKTATWSDSKRGGKGGVPQTSLHSGRCLSPTPRRPAVSADGILLVQKKRAEKYSLRAPAIIPALVTSLQPLKSLLLVRTTPIRGASCPSKNDHHLRLRQADRRSSVPRPLGRPVGGACRTRHSCWVCKLYRLVREMK